MVVDASGLVRLGIGPDHLRVVLQRLVADTGEAERLQQEIVERARAVGMMKVLFDYRQVGSHSQAVRDSMWDWAAQADFVAMALLVANDLVRVRMNMTAVAQKVRMRAFLREEDALAWLANAERRKSTSEITKM